MAQDLKLPLGITTAPFAQKPRHVGKLRRVLARVPSLPSAAIDVIELFGLNVQKIANTFRFEQFWRDKIARDHRVIIVPTFNKRTGKHPIWNVALNWINGNSSSGTILELGTNNGGSLKYFLDHLPQAFHLVGFDCFEGLPESWDGLPAGSIRGFGGPVELWADEPEKRREVISNLERGIPFPRPPQPNVQIESGLFSESVTRYLIEKGWPRDLRLIHFDADLYISTRPVLDTICGVLKYRYLILFDEFYSANHEFKAWIEFVELYKLSDWRVLSASEDGSQVLIEVNTQAPIGD
ncbi:hypothetical protein C7U92_06940 [Bradyrhizobium sp. WBOS7]|uniref:Class I SAM-dependent methyltransferase n=2 Tax=Nitrobacteraceae TaxID=41294 RepID=A0AAE9NE67_9BRAD|nr:hypothetical protein [Bradyrhizobium sp. WBOS2]MDD1569353.1 hypothetical protein [Bradyrhizobium sp. WBOS1]MDD1576472.1 hypothetical protein [Bradyrhizobium sp. WBOS7]MDD1602313.1 hypothetical protein [Bradyrhizobium sp. WBOS16]UUO39245.1 hypothetical protein DCK84_28550 [Bradyrhizobium sp. WBOS01]UUO45416.1 hypothetical protein DCM75_28520 [Bradyrhizobium sp. WBOS02]UUO57457.1 hypothetical protein DCM79_18115 [Bradyrhizobium sp. WBOS07]UUO69877.1 hypothetical protein DCM83_28225 [Bradyrh